MKNCFLAILFFVLIACQQKNTIGVAQSGLLIESKNYRNIIKENTVVFDTRTPFEFNLSKIPGSINLPVSDFTVESDLKDAARRLSLYGVNFDTPVLIVGMGNGEEQKLAWEFLKLGITKIDILNIEVFRQLNLKPEANKQNVLLWTPLNNFFELNVKDLREYLKKGEPKKSSKSRTEAFQTHRVANALKNKVLFLGIETAIKIDSSYSHVEQTVLPLTRLVDEKGLVDLGLLENLPGYRNPKNYDVLILEGPQSVVYYYAFALLKAGARSIIILK